jgi:DNA-binding MarR family transcriptional regulator
MAETIPGATIQTAQELRRAVALLSRRMRRLRADHGISAAKLSVLGHLYRGGAPVTAVELARLENLQPQSLTRIIAELDERGLVTRRQDAADRRQILIAITDSGKALLVQDAREQTIWLARAIEAQLTGTEQAMLHLGIGLLGRLSGFAGADPESPGGSSDGIGSAECDPPEARPHRAGRPSR